MNQKYAFPGNRGERNQISNEVGERGSNEADRAAIFSLQPERKGMERAPPAQRPRTFF
jgi:hypothetical protein